MVDQPDELKIGKWYRLLPEVDKLEAVKNRYYQVVARQPSGSVRVRYNKSCRPPTHVKQILLHLSLDVSTESDHDPNCAQEPKQAAEPKRFKIGYWYKAVDTVTCFHLVEGKYYQVTAIRNPAMLCVGNPKSFHYYYTERFDIDTESATNPDAVTKDHDDQVDMQTSYNAQFGAGLDIQQSNLCMEVPQPTIKYGFAASPQNGAFSNIQPLKELTMDPTTRTTQNRRTATVELWDRSPAVVAAKSLVATFSVVTEHDDNTTIRQVCMNEGVANKISAYNKIRTAEIDLDILKRTGNEVKLRPVTETDLTWVVK